MTWTIVRVCTLPVRSAVKLHGSVLHAFRVHNASLFAKTAPLGRKYCISSAYSSNAFSLQGWRNSFSYISCVGNSTCSTARSKTTWNGGRTQKESVVPPTDASIERCSIWANDNDGHDLVVDIASQIRESVRSYTMSVSDGRFAPPRQRHVKLVGITTSNEEKIDPYAEKYSEHIELNCAEDGIDYQLWRVPQTPQDVEAAIRQANEFESVHGVVVFYPIFNLKPPLDGSETFMSSSDLNKRTKLFDSTEAAKSQRGPYKNRLTGVYYKTYDDYFRDFIPHTIDVEGLCHSYNARWMFRHSKDYVDRGSKCGDDEDDAVIFPCTALAVARILESCHWMYNAASPIGQRFEGTVVTIINRSEILGRPLAAMLANDGATVYSVDIDSILLFRSGGRMRLLTGHDATVECCVRKSSVIVTGVPSKKFKLPVEWIRRGSTVINVASEQNVDEEAVKRVPGVFYVSQIGTLTAALLEHNLVLLHQRYHAISEE